MNFYILVIVILLIGFFVNLSSLIGFWGNFLFKASLLGAFLILFKKERRLFSFPIPGKQTSPAAPAENAAPKPAIKENTRRRQGISLLDCLNDQEHHIKEFVKSQFDILYNYLIPTNGYVFLSDRDGNTYLVHKAINHPQNWSESHSLPGFINLMINTARDILIENHIQNVSNLIPFYDQSAYKPASIFAMYTELENGYRLYWAFDSQAADHFNEEELILPKQVNFTTSYVLDNILRYENLLQENYDTARLMQLAVSLNGAHDFKQALDLFVEAISREFVADKLTIAFREENGRQPEKAVIEKSIGQEDFLKSGQRFNLEDGLHGWVIMKNKIYLIEDMEQGEYFIPRFSKSEKTNYGLRSFLSVPVGDKERAMGMVSLEHKKPSIYKMAEKNKLHMYINLLSSVIKRFSEKEDDTETPPSDTKKRDEPKSIP